MVSPRSSAVDRVPPSILRQLEENPDSWQPILAAARKGNVTLIYSSHDPEHNNVIALKDFLIRKLDAEKSR
jgi:uncharacterized protein YeaO (DUF488 family)